MYKACSALVLAALLIAPAAYSQDVRSDVQGFGIGVHLNGTAWALEDWSRGEAGGDETDNGGGLGLDLSYGFTQHVAIFGRADAASMEQDGEDGYALAHVDLGARFTLLGQQSALRPYGEVAVLGNAATFEVEGEDVEISGTGLTFGGGVKYFVSKSLAIDLGVAFSGGTIKEVKVGDLSLDIDENNGQSSARFNAGLVWYPGH